MLGHVDFLVQKTTRPADLEFGYTFVDLLTCTLIQVQVSHPCPGAVPGKTHTERRTPQSLS